ncbi:MAG: glycosyl transferase family 39 [Planctomycetaceae bacterium]|nr:glycosyl transferase family 39 [Planctomycetaceae bacterium]
MDVRTSNPKENSSAALIPNQRSGHYLVLLAVGLFVFVTNLGGTRLWDVDEAIFSEAAVEMMHRGDWITPYYNGRLFAHKPPLMYWCQIAAFQVLGTTEFAARLFSALFCIGTLLVTYELGRTLFNARTGFWAGIVLAGCINYVVIARAATPDAHLTFFCTLALLILVRGTRGRFPANTAGRSSEANQNAGPWQPVLPPSWSTYAMSYAVMAVATLVKGPVGIILPMAVWGMFLLIEQQAVERRKLGLPMNSDRTDPVPHQTFLQVTWESCKWFLQLFWPTYFLRTVWRMRPLTAIMAVVLIAGPWYVLVGQRTNGEFLREFFFVQNVGRASYAMDSHRGPFFYYLLAACIGTFPWCVLVWPSIAHLARGLRNNDPARAGFLLVCCWVCVWIGCFSLVATKLASYIIPAYPAIAIGFAALVDSWLRETSTIPYRPWLRRAWITFALVAVVAFIAVPITTRILFYGELAPAFLGLIPLVGAIIGWHFSERGQIRGAIYTLAVVSVLFGPATLGLAVLPIDAHKNTHLLGESIHQHSSGTAHVATYKYSPPSLIFYSQIPFDRLRNRDSVAEHFRNHPRDAFLVTSEKHLEGLAPYLPKDVTTIRKERLFLKLENVVLLGRVATQETNVVRGTLVNRR